MQQLVLIIAGVALAVAGVTDGVDAIVPWVFGIVDDIGWGEVWRPLYNPEPMDTYAYRPLSVLALKVLLAITGREVVAITALHALVLPCFALAARGFLIRHGFGSRVATLAALTSLAVPSLLFSAWICVEFDLVGAAVVLAAANQLVDVAAGRRGPAGFWLLAVVAMTIKETSALQMLAYLVAFAWVRRGERPWWRWVLAYLGGLLVCTAPMHFVDSGNTHAFTMWSEGFHPIRIPAMLLHTAAQLLFATSFAGALLVFGAGLRRWVGPRALAVTLAALAVVLVAAAPLLRYYSHFEAVVFSDGVWTVAWATALAVGVGLALASEQEAPMRVLLWTVVLTFLGYAAAPIVLRFARADVSARIFAACIPALHALAWREVVHLWGRGRLARVVGSGLGVMLALYAVSAATNTAGFYRTRILVETEVKERLAGDVRMGCPAFINTNPVQLLTIEELRALGAKRLGDCAWVQTTTANPGPGMSFDEFAGTGEVHADVGQDVYLFVQTARSLMDPALGPALAGDFSWAQGLMPESDDDLFAGYQRMIYEIETDIEALFRQQGLLIARARAGYVQLPLWWNELPARLARGVPLLEEYEYLAVAYRIPARRPGFIPEGGRIRPDTARRQTPGQK